jgi:hypothetical protein
MTETQLELIAGKLMEHTAVSRLSLAEVVTLLNYITSLGVDLSPAAS